jgi:hypothetical protein
MGVEAADAGNHCKAEKSRPGNDLTSRFPLIVEALARLRSRSCIIDGEAVACDDKRRERFSERRPYACVGTGRFVPVCRCLQQAALGTGVIEELLNLCWDRSRLRCDVGPMASNDQKDKRGRGRRREANWKQAWANWKRCPKAPA